MNNGDVIKMCEEKINVEKWNNIMKDAKNGKCKKHAMTYWWGENEMYPNTVGFNCPKCEYEHKGTFSERTWEIFKRGKY